MLAKQLEIEVIVKAQSANQITIEYVQNSSTKELYLVREYIGSFDKDQMIGKRTELREKLSQMVCAECKKAVIVSSNRNKTFFFKHKFRNENCKFFTPGTLSREELLARIYNGRTESPAHIALKGNIYNSLLADCKFSKILVEKRISSKSDIMKFKIPDVQTIYENKLIVFEAQVSSTFLDVVLARKSFYEKNDALLIWCLPKFDFNNRRLMVDDIIYNNNHNILVVDDETCKRSIKERTFFIKCWYAILIVEDEETYFKWKNEIVPFEKLVLDFENQRSYLYDFDKFDIRNKHPRDHFLFEVNLFIEDDYKKIIPELQMFLGLDYLNLISLPDEYTNLRNAIRVFCSAERGFPVGFKYKQLIEVVHYLAENHKFLLRPFFKIAKKSGTYDKIMQQDKKELWERKARKLRMEFKKGEIEDEFTEDQRIFLGSLFPKYSDLI